MRERTSPDWQNVEDSCSHSALPPADVEAQLNRILESCIFRKAPRHSRFLSFVVNKALSGQGDEVKEYLIGLEVFDRKPDFDPGSDPVVRSEARRLRFRLAEYYREAGKLDPIHIDLPKGAYVPVFYRNGVEPQLEEAAADKDCSSCAAYRPFPAADGAQENRGITSEPRGGSENPAAPAVSRARRLLTLKILAGTVVMGIAAFILIRMLTMDNRPQAGRLEGSTLIVSNAKGQELWRKGFSDGFWPDYYQQGLAPRIWFGDLEGKGHYDVLLLYHPAVNPISHSTTLICYSDRGKEKWRWTPGRDLPELEGNPATYRTVGFGVLKPTNGEHPRIVASSFHVPFYPHQIAIVDSNGKTVAEYWHSGHLDYLTLADLDGDGREEIVAPGISNGYRQATLVVLDPDRVFGASTELARPEIQLHGMGVAGERLRLLFPRSDLNKTLSVYNQGREVTVEDGRTRLSVVECWQQANCEIWYEFDRNFHLISAQASDTFRSAHAEFYLRSKPFHHFDAEEESEFRKVRCLVGCKTEFVLSQNH